jgi:hypothetical protein
VYDRVRDGGLPVWRLTFDAFPGLEVRVTVPTLQARAREDAASRLIAARRDQDRARGVAMLAALFADSLVSWNLLWAGRPVPATRAGVLRVDHGLMAEILREWTALWPLEHRRPAAVEPVLDAQAEADLAELAALPMTPLDPAPLEAPA